MSCFCDYEPATVWRQSLPKARAAYRCEECGSPISKGEEHEYVFGVWDGYAGSFRTCMRCVDLRQWVKNNIPCTCWAHGNLLEDLRASIDEARDRAPSETRGILFGYLRRLLPIVRRAG
jgi:hypothetical protein